MKMHDILTREAENQQSIYLYEESDGRWYAYEHSARMINRVLEGMVKVSQITYRHIIQKVTIDRAEVQLADLLGCPITLCSDSEMVIEYSPKLYQSN